MDGEILADKAHGTSSMHAPVAAQREETRGTGPGHKDGIQMPRMSDKWNSSEEAETNGALAVTSVHPRVTQDEGRWDERLGREARRQYARPSCATRGPRPQPFRYLTLDLLISENKEMGQGVTRPSSVLMGFGARFFHRQYFKMPFAVAGGLSG